MASQLPFYTGRFHRRLGLGRPHEITVGGGDKGGGRDGDDDGGRGRGSYGKWWRWWRTWIVVFFIVVYWMAMLPFDRGDVVVGVDPMGNPHNAQMLVTDSCYGDVMVVVRSVTIGQSVSESQPLPNSPMVPQPTNSASHAMQPSPPQSMPVSSPF